MSDDGFNFEFEGVSPDDPYVKAWADQFGALIRDKVRQMTAAVRLTGWTEMAHVFSDPYDDDKYRLTYYQGEYYLINLSGPDNSHIRLDLEALGVER